VSTSPTGGAQARRAVVRWAIRLFRREWRQQALVLALLTLSVAAAIGFATAAYNTVGVSEDATLGSARHRIDADAPPPRSLPAVVAAAEARFGTVDVFVRWSRPVPGSVESVEFRAQDPAGAFSGPMLALRDGRYPGNADEIALTDGVADQFGLRVGDAFDLDGRDRTVVGMVENPSDLGSEFALASAASRDQADEVTILLGGSGGTDEEQAVQDFATQHLHENVAITSRDSGGENVVAVAAVLGTTTVALMLVSLVAAAGFVVLAQRRLRQLGMLEAIGATDRHVRLVMVASGAALGMVAALTGAGIGLAAWIGVAPRMEAGVGHRIDRWNVPWWVVVAAMALAVVAAVLAAWWPARAVARVPITAALTGRPPRPRSAHHSAALAGVLIAVGVLSLAASEQRNDLLVVTGTAATVAGILLVSPLAIRLAARAVDGLRVGVRLPLRDLARHQARSGAALAAVSLSLGIPVAIVVTATSAESTRPLGNLSDRQLLIWTRDPSQPEGVSPYYTEDPHDEGLSPYLPRLTEADLDRNAESVDRIAAELDDPAVATLELATDPAGEPTSRGRLAVTLARPFDSGSVDVALLFVATPELLGHYGVDLAAVASTSDVLTLPPEVLDGRLPAEARRMLVSDELYLSNTADRPDVVGPVERLRPSYSSLPGSFITPEAVRQQGWHTVRVGWLVEAASPLTAEQIAAARDLAADAWMLVEPPRREPSLAGLRWGATVAGTLVAIGVLAMTAGLVRTEAAGEVRTLTAVGATRRIRRTLSAATAGGLAVLGAALGTAGAYLALVASRVDDIGTLASVPVLHLLVIVLGIPGLAAAVAWLLAGREPATLARQAIE
jgi:putative ABC transport system permease protein